MQPNLLLKNNRKASYHLVRSTVNKDFTSTQQDAYELLFLLYFVKSTAITARIFANWNKQKHIPEQAYGYTNEDRC